MFNIHSDVYCFKCFKCALLLQNQIQANNIKVQAKDKSSAISTEVIASSTIDVYTSQPD